jgi:hypothetical protein
VFVRATCTVTQRPELRNLTDTDDDYMDVLLHRCAEMRDAALYRAVQSMQRRVSHVESTMGCRRGRVDRIAAGVGLGRRG